MQGGLKRGSFDGCMGRNFPVKRVENFLRAILTLLSTFFRSNRSGKKFFLFSLSSFFAAPFLNSIFIPPFSVDPTILPILDLDQFRVLRDRNWIFHSLLFLQKWLEVSSRRRSGPPACELCQYQYLRQKKFVVSISSQLSPYSLRS